MNGDGVEKDPVEAVKWYRKAAEQGHADAQVNLGECFMNGQGVAKDPVDAVKWYRKAAEQGLAIAQLSLGVCFNYGQGVAKNLTEAVEWYRKAAEQGDAVARKRLDDIPIQIDVLTDQFRATLSVSAVPLFSASFTLVCQRSHRDTIIRQQPWKWSEDIV
jgi:hypothetical protein